MSDNNSLKSANTISAREIRFKIVCPFMRDDMLIIFISIIIFSAKQVQLIIVRVIKRCTNFTTGYITYARKAVIL